MALRAFQKLRPSASPLLRQIAFPPIPEKYEAPEAGAGPDLLRAPPPVGLGASDAWLTRGRAAQGSGQSFAMGRQVDAFRISCWTEGEEARPLPKSADGTLLPPSKAHPNMWRAIHNDAADPGTQETLEEGEMQRSSSAPPLLTEREVLFQRIKRTAGVCSEEANQDAQTAHSSCSAGNRLAGVWS